MTTSANPPRPTFYEGDIAHPKAGNLGAGLPSGRVRKWVRWGFGQLLYIGDEKKPHPSGLFDKDEAPA